MKEGAPHIQAAAGTAAEFIVKMVHKYPGEVVLWAGGPLTNYALALKLDPEVATLAKEFVMMGGGLYADKGRLIPVPSMRAGSSTGGSIRRRHESCCALLGRK